jgi:hypothetical protein
VETFGICTIRSFSRRATALSLLKTGEFMKFRTTDTLCATLDITARFCYSLLMTLPHGPAKRSHQVLYRTECLPALHQCVRIARTETDVSTPRRGVPDERSTDEGTIQEKRRMRVKGACGFKALAYISRTHHICYLMPKPQQN